jgi:anti-sigma regulatory factor (Ser/Thr protein kinase)
MPGGGGWGTALLRVRTSLIGTTDLDAVARAVLRALADAPDVVRAGIALREQAGRLLKFASTDSLDAGQPAWCDIDGLADVPLVHAVLSRSPVLLGDTDNLGRDYPHLLERQVGLGVRALAAVPLLADGASLGALLISYGRPQQLGAASRRALDRLAQDVAGAVLRVRAGGHTHTAPAPATRDGDAWSVTARLEGGETAPREARSFLRRELGDWGLGPELVDPAELCLSELVTNAVIHAGTAIQVALRLDGDRLRVAVRDNGTSGQVHRRPVPAPDDIGGRGLMLVEVLSAGWHSERDARGTTVSFDLAVAPEG